MKLEFQFYWNTAIFIHLCIIYGHFTPKAEMVVAAETVQWHSLLRTAACCTANCSDKYVT